MSGGYTPALKQIPLKAEGRVVRRGRADHEIWESPISGRRFAVDAISNPDIRQMRS